MNDTVCSNFLRLLEKKREKLRPLTPASGHTVPPELKLTPIPASQVRRIYLFQPILLFELFGEVLLGQVLEVLAGEGVQFVFEPAREHPLDLLLPGLLLEPLIVEELAGAGDVLVVELDAHAAGEPVGFGVPAGEPDELGLRNGHALTFEGKIDRALLDDRVDVVAPGVVVHEDIDGQPLLLVQPPRQAPDPAGRLAVSRQENAIVRPPELVFGETVPLGAFLDQEDEIGCATPDL